MNIFFKQHSDVVVIQILQPELCRAYDFGGHTIESIYTCRLVCRHCSAITPLKRWLTGGVWLML